MIDCNVAGIEITKKMSVKAKEWTDIKAPRITQHFTQKRISKKESIFMASLGEIAFCEMMDIDWESRKIENKPDIDAITNKGKIMEIKTYSVPSPYFEKLIRNELDNDDLYGRCLFLEKQAHELGICDYVFWGVFQDHEYNVWYPIGYMSSHDILERYTAQTHVCDGRVKLPQIAFTVGNQDVRKLRKWYNIADEDINIQQGQSMEKGQV